MMMFCLIGMTIKKNVGSICQSFYEFILIFYINLEFLKLIFGRWVVV